MGRGAGERSLFVDSGAWIAYFSLRDGRHREADALLRAAVAVHRRLVTTNLVLAEVHAGCSFGPASGPRPPRSTGSTRRPWWRSSTDCAHHRAARAWLARLGDQRITYTDAVSFAVMTALGCRAALTFDSDFAVAGFTPWQPEVGGA